jgi:hypothetical protein
MLVWLYKPDWSWLVREEETHGQISAVVHLIGSMLASGVIGTGALSAYLAVAASVSHCWDRCGRCAGIRHIGDHAARKTPAQGLDIDARPHHFSFSHAKIVC